MNKTRIGWTDYTSNPIYALGPDGKRGWFCEMVSPGCAHCYAREMNLGPYGNGLDYVPANRSKAQLVLNERELAEWRKPKYAGKKCFPFDMSDLFGEWVSDEWLDQIFAAMALAPAVTFQVLTKRAERMLEYMRTADRFNRLGYQAVQIVIAAGPAVGHKIKKAITEAGVGLPESWPLPNLWLGVSAENQEQADARIPDLLGTPAAVRFVSVEPMLEPVDLSRWLRYNPGYEVNRVNRGIRLSGGAIGGDPDQRRRVDLARNRGTRQQVEPGDQTGPRNPAQDRRAGGERLSDSQGNASPEASFSASSPSSLASLQGSNSSRPHDQSPERRQRRQPTGEPGTGDLFGAADSLDLHSQDFSRRESEWQPELPSEVNRGASQSHSAEAAARREFTFDSSRLPDQLQDSFTNRPSQEMGTHHLRSDFWVIVGAESGPRRRPFDNEWARWVKRQCNEAGVAVWLKQGSGRFSETPFGDTEMDGAKVFPR